MTGAGRIALLTVATEAFVPGAEVMLASFLRRHPGFSGDLVVIHDGLGGEALERLLAISPAVRPSPVGADIAGRVEALVARLPSMRPTRARFYSLESLRPRGYDSVLFCDSDLLFLGSVARLFGGDADVRAVGDGCFLRGKARDAETFAERDAGAGNTIGSTFNAGLMRLGAGALTGEDFAAMLSRLECGWFSRLECGLHDQALFNLQFHGRAKLESWRYNFLMRHRRRILAAERLTPSDLRVLHFNTGVKPWQAQGGAMERDPLLGWGMRSWREMADTIRR